MVKEQDTESKRIGLKMNKTKPKTLFANAAIQSNIVVDNESLGLVDQYASLYQNIHAMGARKISTTSSSNDTGKFGKLSQYL